MKPRERTSGSPEASDEPVRRRYWSRSPIATLVLTALLLSPADGLAASTPRSSLLLLIDTSGSMRNEIGNGNSDVKIAAAKQAASGALRQAAQKGNVEVAVLAFEGDCARPVPRSVGFTTDFNELERFVASLQPGGGTPMAAAVIFANRFMQSRKARTAQDQMIVLLADGQNDCGSVTDALAELKSSGVIFRHETIGFGIEPDSDAARDLQNIATASGGTYHHAADATQLGDLFMKFVDTSTVIDLLGTFGRRSGPADTTPQTQPTKPTQPKPPDTPPAQVTDLLGAFGSVNTADPDSNHARGNVLCYRKFSNPHGLDGLRPYSVTEFTCASSCRSLGASPFPTGETRAADPPGMSCGQQCRFAASSAFDAQFVWGRSNNENHCVAVLDSLQAPVAVEHHYRDCKDNKHQLVWQARTRPTRGFRVYLNHYPDRNDQAEYLGSTLDDRFDFEYGQNFRDNPVVDGLNLWNPFPRMGVSACNKYGTCTPVVYGDVVSDCAP